MTDPVRVLVADDQPLLRHSLRLIIDGSPGLVAVGEAGNGEQAVAQTRTQQPDVVLMDVRMPALDGIAATGMITSDPALRARVLVLSMFDLDEYVYAALRAGASGFLLKDARPEQLLDAIRRTHDGESLFAPGILTRLVEHFLAVPPSRTIRCTDLTGRETQLLTLVGRGLSNTEIAAALTISMGTVKTHIGNLLAKLAARDRAQLVIAAYERHLVVPGSGGGPDRSHE